MRRGNIGERGEISNDAQVILSIPNSRNLNLVTALVDQGSWTYAEKGLLDITHIRFFTLKEIAAFLSQTGYHIERVDHFINSGFENLLEQSKHKKEINIRSGRFSLEGLSYQELIELCTWQFFIRARPI